MSKQSKRAAFAAKRRRRRVIRAWLRRYAGVISVDIKLGPVPCFRFVLTDEA